MPASPSRQQLEALFEDLWVEVHRIETSDELQALGVAFVSLAEGIDATTPAGKLQMHILAAIAEFERARIVERVRAGLARRASAPTTSPERPR